MRILRIIFLAAFSAMAGFGAPTSMSRAHDRMTVSISFFYERLGPHGEWVRHNRWGWVWYPTGVAAEWRPYLRGRWLLTDDYGWYWQSDEPWAWATYHYGRWAYDPDYGWIWVPGYRWGPSWVAWRFGDTYVGWAALPPEVGYSDDSGVLWGGIDLSGTAYVSYWVFVPGSLFLGQRVDRHALPRTRNLRVLRATRNVTRFERRNGRIFNRGPRPSAVTRRFGKRIPTVRVQRVDRPESVRRIERGNVINVFRPRVRRNAALRPPTRTDPKPPRTRGQRREVPVKPRGARRSVPSNRTIPRQPDTRPGAPGRTAPETDRQRTRERPPKRTRPDRGPARVRIQPQKPPRKPKTQKRPTRDPATGEDEPQNSRQPGRASPAGPKNRGKRPHGR